MDDQDIRSTSKWAEDKANGICYCTTAADLGMGSGEGINPGMIAYVHPDCPIHWDLA